MPVRGGRNLVDYQVAPHAVEREQVRAQQSKGLFCPSVTWKEFQVEQHIYMYSYTRGATFDRKSNVALQWN